MERRAHPRVVWFVAIGGLLVILGTLMLAGGVGLVLLPVGVAFLAAIPFRGRRSIVVGLVAGAAAFSAAYLLTAPLSCAESAGTGPGRRQVVTTTCTRVVLADLDREPRPADYLLAVSVAAGAAVVVGIGVGLVSGRVGRPPP
jgi:hypothetical protein